jgi:putative transposase
VRKHKAAKETLEDSSLQDTVCKLCSTRTVYRILEEEGERPQYHKSELLATAHNQLWIWDITQLRSPAKWTYFPLYVILDVFSRYVVGWMVALRDSAELVHKKLIQETYEKEDIQPGQLGLHAGRDSAMRSQPVALLLADLS